ncbi:MAG: phosphatidylglycerophosphatase A [Opitutales bacterium]|jgi:phosphatidylglycerophosphatase A
MKKRSSLPLMSRLPDRLVHAVATLGGLGNVGPAPGTLGSVAGTLFYALILQNASSQFNFFAVLALFGLGLFFCDEAELRIGRPDPGSVIFDEFAAMPIVFLGLETSSNMYWRVILLLLGFAAFRVLDILKPLGISRIQDLPGGLGIMADDVAAALVACAFMHLVSTLAG